MSYVIAAPDIMTATATDLATIGSTLDVAHMLAAAPTLAVTPAAADEVSTVIAQLFSQHAQGYQALARQAAAFQEQFVANLKTSAASYTSIEDAIASFLNSFSTVIGNVQYGLSELLGNISYNLSHLDEYVANLLARFFATPIGSAVGAAIGYAIFWGGFFGILGFIGIGICIEVVGLFIQSIAYLLGSA
jgi:hypothetical protein